MRRILFTLSLLLLAASSAWASSAPGLPASSGESLLGPSSERATPRYLLSSAEMDAVLQQDEESLPDWESAQASGAPRRWWPLLLSAALPGLGEATTGYTRGYFLIAADLASLGLAYSENEKGDEKEEDYLAFADAHWSEELWEEALRTTDTSPWFGTNYQSKEEVPLYVSKEEDEREYYENLGKWDIFWYGWSDSRTDIGADPYWDWNSPPENFMTPLRDQYLDMRTESNDAYESRDRYLAVSLLLRVFSVLEVAYLEGFIGGKYNNGYEGPGVGGTLTQSDLDGRRLNWFVDASNPKQSRLGLQLRY